MIEAPRRPAYKEPELKRAPEQKASAQTMQRFQDLVVRMIRERLDQLAKEGAVRMDIGEEDIRRLASEIDMAPANDKMSEADMRDLLAMGSTIDTMARKLAGLSH